MHSPGKSALKAKWDSKKDSCLIGLLLTHTQASEKSDSGFKAKVWNAIAAEFGKKWPRLKPKQLQCRAQVLTANYKIFQALVDNSGFGWDDENKLNTTPNSVWVDYIEKHPKAAEYRFQTLPLYEELHEIYGTGAPPGKRVTSTIQPIDVHDKIHLDSDKLQTRDPSINPNLSEDWNTGLMHLGGNDDDDDDDESQRLVDSIDELPQRKRPLTSLDVTPAPNKSRRTSVHQSAAKMAKEGMQELGESMKAALVHAAELPSITRFDQCLPLLSEMRRDRILDNNNYLQYSKLLRGDEKLAAMFVGMDSDLRVQWLEMESESAFK